MPARLSPKRGIEKVEEGEGSEEKGVGTPRTEHTYDMVVYIATYFTAHISIEENLKVNFQGIIIPHLPLHRPRLLLLLYPPSSSQGLPSNF